MHKINNIAPDDSKYLQMLSNIANSPKSLYIMGKLPETRIPTVAIVGSRKPTAYGREVAHKLAYELAQAGIVIVSGLCRGIDGFAHQAALEAGGITIAVLPTSIEQVYPAAHRELAQNIVTKGGALISEYGHGDPIYKQNFVMRNRIVTGISDAVIIVEAAARSGTLGTAKFALNQGKTVMAVPGHITSPMSAGCNNLIKAGAAPITETNDVLMALGLDQPKKVRKNQLPLVNSPEEYTIVSLIQNGIRDGDELQQKSGLTVAEFNQTLTLMEINGTIRPLGANNWSL